MLHSVSSEITRTRLALLAYVARYGVKDETDCRQLAARLWRAIPRSLNAAEAVVATDRLLSAWASKRMGFPVSAAQLRLAVLVTGADARQLLGDDVAAFAAAIAPALIMATPQETPLDMPLQSLGRAGFMRQRAVVPVAVTRAA